jgi:hypothetical protein
MTRLIISGSLGYDDRGEIVTTLDAIVRLAGGEVITIVHADVPGAESIAASIAQRSADSGLVDEPHAWSPTVAAEMIALGADELLVFGHRGGDLAAVNELRERAADAGIPCMASFDTLSVPR